MPKFEIESLTELRSAFFERRRLRRIRMIVELTHNLISSDRTVSHREARCLVDCARKAIIDLFPGFDERYERVIRPHFDRVLHERWPNEDFLDTSDCNDWIN
jgi:CRP-like cAMP-binding protein